MDYFIINKSAKSCQTRCVDEPRKNTESASVPSLGIQVSSWWGKYMFILYAIKDWFLFVMQHYYYNNNWWHI